jgi:hypothetical protein
MQTRRLGVEKLYPSRGALDGVIKRLTVPMNIRIARSIRRACRITFWLSTVLLLISLLRIGWLTGAFAVIVVLALFIDLGALKVGQTLTGREFAAVLAADPGTNRPIVLFLRSFDVARSSLVARFIRELGVVVRLGSEVLQLDFIVQILRLGFEALQGAGGSTHPLVPHRPYEVEENLDNAIGLNAMFVALGDRLASYGAAKITVKDEEWQNIFYRLANASQLIFMMPGPSPGALWELWQIMWSRSLREKTVFIMPPEGSGVAVTACTHPREWETVSDVAAELGVKFPPYSHEGCYFRLREEDHLPEKASRQVMERRLMRGIISPAIIVPAEIVALEPFTRALGKFVTSPAYTGVIDFANIRKLV